MNGNLTAPLLRVTGLRIQSASGADLLGDVSLQMAAGEKLAVLGPSGAGKSLLAHAIAGVLRPPLRKIAGEICFADSTGAHGRPVFLMFQNPGAALNPCRRIRTQLRDIAARARRAPVDASVDSAVAQCGLTSADADRYPFQISGGMKQRAVFAAALVQRPALLIADEVTTALDPLSRREFRGSLDTLLECSGAALLFITHDLGLAAEICPKALVLEQGRMVAHGAWSDLGKQNRTARALMSAALTLGEPLC
jgi:ABC-type glutathione transport system ATPase component